jgi:hypothetical protein
MDQPWNRLAPQGEAHVEVEILLTWTAELSGGALYIMFENHVRS